MAQRKRKCWIPKKPIRSIVARSQANHRRRNIRYPRHSISRSYPFYRSINRAAHEIFFLASNPFTVGAERDACKTRLPGLDRFTSFPYRNQAFLFWKQKLARAIINDEEIRSGRILFRDRNKKGKFLNDKENIMDF